MQNLRQVRQIKFEVAEVAAREGVWSAAFDVDDPDDVVQIKDRKRDRAGGVDRADDVIGVVFHVVADVGFAATRDVTCNAVFGRRGVKNAFLRFERHADGEERDQFFARREAAHFADVVTKGRSHMPLDERLQLVQPRLEGEALANGLVEEEEKLGARFGKALQAAVVAGRFGNVLDGDEEPRFVVVGGVGGVGGGERFRDHFVKAAFVLVLEGAGKNEKGLRLDVARRDEVERAVVAVGETRLLERFVKVLTDEILATLDADESSEGVVAGDDAATRIKKNDRRRQRVENLNDVERRDGGFEHKSASLGIPEGFERLCGKNRRERERAASCESRFETEKYIERVRLL